VAMAPYAPLAAVALAAGAVQFVPLDQPRAIEPVPLAPGLGAVRFRSDGRLLMVAERARRRLTFLDPEVRRIVAELPLPLSPDQLAVHPDGGQVFLTGEGRDAVVVVYPYRTEIAQTSLSGRRPGRMAVSTMPPFLFVSNPEANSVSVFDVQTQKVVAVTGVGVRPTAIAITPDQQYALVLNEESGDVAVIRMSAISPGRAKRAPLFTMIPAGDRPVDIRIFSA
jgi:YVTN family beta-propeller protein